MAPADVLDIRLAIGAGAAWLAVIACLARAPNTVLVTALAGAALGFSALLASFWRSRGGPVQEAASCRPSDTGRGAHQLAALALLGFCVALVLLPLAARAAVSRAGPLHQLAKQGAAVTVELTTTADPVLLAAKGVAGTARVIVAATADSVLVRGRAQSVDGAILVLGGADQWRRVLPGQHVLVDGTLRPSLDVGSMSVTLFTTGTPRLVGRPPWWQRAAGSIRASLRAACSDLPEQVRGLLPGLVDGDTSGLDPVLGEQFRLAGLTHLIAVSGTNCAILIGIAMLVLRRLRVRPWVCALVGVLVLVGFVVIARPSPSVLRAAVMGLITLGGLASGRPRQAMAAVAAAVLALLVYNPQLAVDAGFTMSVLATAALLILAPPWVDALRRRRVPPVLAEAIAVAAAAHLVTAPIIAAISGRVSLVAIPANILAEPVVAAATVLGFAAALIAPIWLAPAGICAQLAGWPCRWLIWDADHLGSIHGATIPWPGGVGGGLALLAVMVAIVAIARRVGPRQMLAAGGVIALIVQIPVRAITSTWPPPGWTFIACDVGQGDALLLSAGPHSAVEIDAGPDPLKIDRCLRDLGIDDIPLLVFSHYHLDHVGGVVGVFHGRHVGQVVTGPLADPESGVELVHDTIVDHGLTISTPAAGTSFVVGAVRLDVLGPVATLHDTRSDPNNDSLVLRATVNGTRILLPGDAELEEQQELLDAGADLRADVLKVPHHGSAYSLPAFLAAVHARVAVVSVGLHNDYGHPSPVLLTEMVKLGVPLRRTDQDGDVAVSGDPGHLAVMIRGPTASAVGS
ncbi:MAG: ComEC/Rec2 family competence protein [Jatrophihabitantaceae bacterium]